MRWLSLEALRSGGRRRAPKRRLRRAPDWRRRLRIGVAAGVLALVAGLGWLWQDGWFGRQANQILGSFHEATARGGLKIDEILVEGRARTLPGEILEALAVTRGSPILAFDPHAAKARLEALPWVGEATVERRLPGEIVVRLRERRPLALWQNHGRLAVIDQAGEVIRGAAPESFAQLPLLVGEDAPAHAAELLALLDSEPDLRGKVAAAVRVRGRRWNVRLAGGIDVRLPEADAGSAWAQLARLQREHDLLQRNVVAIDLRMPDRLIVRTGPGSAGSEGPAGEDT